MRGKKKGLQFGRGCCLVWFISHTEVLADVKNFGGFKAGVVLGGVGFYSGKLAAFIFFSIFVESRSFASAFPSFCGVVFCGAPNVNIAGRCRRLSCGHGLWRRRGRLPPWPLGRRWGFFFFLLLFLLLNLKLTFLSPFWALLGEMLGSVRRFWVLFGFCLGQLWCAKWSGWEESFAGVFDRGRARSCLIWGCSGNVGFYVMIVGFFLVAVEWTVLWWDLVEWGACFCFVFFFLIDGIGWGNGRFNVVMVMIFGFFGCYWVNWGGVVRYEWEELLAWFLIVIGWVFFFFFC